MLEQQLQLSKVRILRSHGPHEEKHAKKPAKKKATKRQPKKFSHLSDSEKELVKKKWHGQGKTPTEVAEWLERDLPATDRRLKRLDDGSSAPKVGRPPALTPEQEEKVVKKAKGGNFEEGGK